MPGTELQLRKLMHCHMGMVEDLHMMHEALIWQWALPCTSRAGQGFLMNVNFAVIKFGGPGIIVLSGFFRKAQGQRLILKTFVFD